MVLEWRVKNKNENKGLKDWYVNKRLDMLRLLESSGMEYLRKGICRVKLVGSFYDTYVSKDIFRKKSIVGFDLTFLDEEVFTKVVRISSHFSVSKKLYYNRNYYSMVDLVNLKKKKDLQNIYDYFKVIINYDSNLVFLKDESLKSNNVNFNLKFNNVRNSLDMLVSNDQVSEYKIRYDSKFYICKAEECRVSFVSNKYFDMFMLYVNTMYAENLLGSTMDDLFYSFFDNESRS